jgi:hypothetical protein
MALALACVFQSQSRSKPGQSHGFQAKLGRHITNHEMTAHRPNFSRPPLDLVEREAEYKVEAI